MATRLSKEQLNAIEQIKAADHRYQVFTVLKGGEVACAVCYGTSLQYRDRYSLSRHLATKSHGLACRMQELEDAYNRHCFDEQAQLQRQIRTEVRQIHAEVLQV